MNHTGTWREAFLWNGRGRGAEPRVHSIHSRKGRNGDIVEDLAGNLISETYRP